MTETTAQTAWTILLRRPDVPLAAKAWPGSARSPLTTGYRTTRPREQPAGVFLPDHQTGELPAPAAPAGDSTTGSPTGWTAAAELDTLTARERRYLALQAIGLNYSEIAVRESASQRTVERQLMRAKRKLRQHHA